MYRCGIPATAIFVIRRPRMYRDISIYPNPASDVLNISGAEGTEFKINNAAGQLVSKGKISDQKVPVRDLSKGIYFIRIKDKENMTQLKFIKK
ncbi:T9SS type A sorting domain-containing protein [uncultured Chryseobacterium sp.]|uniref:T9SS type A sorting domain-containing protein n=1 Tax=uncultured Chryseobacterium sp. TaxID=259322 RepID=UPI0025E185CC|nr:T9SS type A sorting domain-containing protein [uncultured Chryseobacterium sp.]